MVASFDFHVWMLCILKIQLKASIFDKMHNVHNTALRFTHKFPRASGL
jgi:hypothetical protein